MLNRSSAPSRRAVLMMAASAAALATVGCSKPSNAAASSSSGPVLIERFDVSGKSLGTASLPKVVKTEAQWRAQLTPLAFEVTRQEGTERAYTGEYADNHEDGLYRCIGCDTALFASRTFTSSSSTT